MIELGDGMGDPCILVKGAYMHQYSDSKGRVSVRTDYRYAITGD